MFKIPRNTLFAIALLCSATTAFGQGSVFGVMGGPSLGIQRWNSIDQQPLFKYHALMFIETLDDENVLFARLGYHVRGSAIRNVRFNLQGGGLLSLPTREFQFRNAALAAGFKKKFDAPIGRAYYMLGLRGEFTINTNLSQLQEANQFLFFLPDDGFVRRLNYGAIFGGGIEFPFSDLVGGVIELSVSPDLSFQYLQPALPNVPSPTMPGQNITIQERKIRNISIELSLGIRLKRIIEYID